MSEPGILPQPIPFGKYYLLERINVGGMAEVYKAKAFGVEGFERLLAVKKILSSIAEDESFIEMFIDEAKIAGQLNHPNIAQIFDLGKVEDSYFIALEYIGGKDLKTIFERARRLGEKVSIPRICYVVMKVCEGLAHAHHKKDAQGRELNIVHRDVSPQNVLISYEGEVKIIDFGIAKAQGKTSQTQVGILKGKFSYMSPEQVRGLHVDQRSDIFSLGIVLYEMLTLERLFLGESDFDTLEKIRKVEMSPPSLYNPHIPKELEDIVLKALSKSPEDRFQTAYEFAEALERFMRNQGYYYTNKDLGAYMKEAFSADIEFENKKLEYYRSLNLQPIQPAPGSNGSNGAGEGMQEGLAWGEEEMETQIFDREPEQEVSDEDIVYAGEDTGEAAETVEYERWNGEREFEFDDDPPGDVQTPGREKQNTAQVSAVEPRRGRVGTVQSPSARKSRSLPLVLAGVLLVVVVAGGLVYGLEPAFLFGSKSPKITVETQPTQVEIWVDGELVYDGETPYDFEVDPGPTTFQLKADGFETFERSRDLVAGKKYTLKQRLEKADDARGGATELLVKTEPPGATIFVDGEKLSEPTPYTITELKPGAHEIRVVKEGYFEETQKLDELPSEPLEMALRPSKVDLEITSTPSRASYAVYVKGTEEKVASGRTTDTVEELDASKTYRVELERRGYEDWEETFEPGDRKKSTMKATLEEKDRPPRVASSNPPRTNDDEKEPDPTPPPPDPKEDDEPKEQKKPKGTGMLTVASKPAARVYIDDQDTGRYTPLLNFKMKSGKHKVRLVNEQFGLDKVYYVNIKPGGSKKIINR